jgi:hypothetical protein
MPYLLPGDLFFAQADGEEFRVPLTAPSHPPIAHLVLPRALLDQMFQSVSWFWDDIETLRVQSLDRKATATEIFLAEAAAARNQRVHLRRWTAPTSTSTG